MNLSKSKYCDGITCNKKLWLKENKPDAESDSNDDSMTFFFEDVYKQNNSRIMNNVFTKSHNINYIDTGL